MAHREDGMAYPPTTLQTAETLTTTLTCQLASLSTYLPPPRPVGSFALSVLSRACVSVCVCVCVDAATSACACRIKVVRAECMRVKVRAPSGTVRLSNVCKLSHELNPREWG